MKTCGGSGFRAQGLRRLCVSAWRGMAWLPVAVWLIAAPVLAEDCLRHDLGGFSLCLPPSWQRVNVAGTDSMVGQFVSAPGPAETAPLRLDYDFGVYSDPLNQLPSGATGITEQNIRIDGLAARLVKYTLPAGNAADAKLTATPQTHFVGLHVPEIQQTAMGFLKLTVMLRSSDEARLREADTVLASIRFKHRSEHMTPRP